ncbi:MULTISPECIES: glycolate oxidase subunit GlcF [unclassified Beijerinckia]|uniref:glycolate oxidase subunit GlcF n=1 Tax=unclassified Beijerinckia TaxID=2638183 RepID=UPI0008941C75|nr:MULTISPECIES: glycolate oxidase subunit GlcF [unclassified Beijerinckia]MDH7799648.1 glycolate oxidase iron-sulfur subunit [Beijerinckia sp. GAS462]SEB48596.1 glycolate oxidase iron-sulfur subunit [Beijerinckia sp. 28-YEA-48]
MRTNFTPEQLQRPEIAEANGILETCVHYGFCTNACPTYVLTRDENEAPRGRIDLIREMLELGGAPKPETVGHLDNCLSCLSCMTTCAAKVDYVHLIDRARVHIEENYRRPVGERLLRSALARILPYPRRFRWALALGRWGTHLRGMMPALLRPLLDMVPVETSTEILAPQIFKAEGVRRHRVALLAGCAQQVLNSHINAATIRLLQRHGCEVVITAGAGCCGSLTLHMGREGDAKASARANVLAWQREIAQGGLDAIIVNASGCGTTVKDYAHLLARDPDMAAPARAIAALACDVTEFLARLGLQAPVEPRAYKVAYHDPCSMQHVQKVIRPPRDLLQAAGYRVQDIAEKHFCCGSAGTYNLLHPAMAERLGQRKAGHIASADPDILATGNIGCMTQIGRYLPLPVVHTVELLDWATGGPKPAALLGRVLRAPPPASVTTKTSASPETDGFW